MARSKNWHTRDNNFISSRRLRLPQLPSFKSTAYTPSVTNYLREIEDRRTWHPEGVSRPARSFNRSRHLLTVYKSPHKEITIQGGYQSPFAIKKLFDTVPVGVQFQTPYKVLICVRRQQRKEVMFAKNKAGRGGQKSPIYSEYSSVRC